MTTLLHNLRMLTRYNHWADDKLFDALEKLPPGAATEKKGFGGMLFNMNHNLIVDRIWKGHLENRPHGYTARVSQDVPPLAELRAAQAEINAWYIAYADDLTDATFDEMIDFKYVDGGPGRLSRGDMMLHIVNHHTYHRGFVGELMFQVPGHRAPTLDLPVFLRDAPPELTLRGSPAQLAA
jgi:uncharacterized damage-inducible protein DinB